MMYLCQAYVEFLPLAVLALYHMGVACSKHLV